MSITISLANISGEFTYSCLINKHLSSVPGNAISRVSYFKNSLLQGGDENPLCTPLLSLNIYHHQHFLLI